MEKKNDFIYSTDSDFAVLLGDECVMIDEIKQRKSIYKKKKQKSKNTGQGGAKTAAASEIILDATSFEVSLSGASNKKMNQLKQSLQERMNNKRSSIKWEKATNPLFEGKSPRFRALIALALGCDVFTSGVKSFGPTTIAKVIDEIKNDVLKAEEARTIKNNNNLLEISIIFLSVREKIYKNLLFSLSELSVGIIFTICLNISFL